MNATKSLRKHIYSVILLLSLAFLLNGCTESNTKFDANVKEKNVPNVEQQKEQIKANLVDMWDAIEKGDIKRYASYIHEDFTQFGETAKVLREGKAAEVKGIKDWVEEPTTVKTKMRDPKVTIKGDVAWITYYWEDEGISKGKPFATKGKSTRIFEKVDGKWLCIHGHYTLLEDDKKKEESS